jgi:hypothetical protein
VASIKTEKTCGKVLSGLHISVNPSMLDFLGHCPDPILVVFNFKVLKKLFLKNIVQLMVEGLKSPVFCDLGPVRKSASE